MPIKPLTCFITTRDGDELNFNWYRDNHSRVVILVHGLGGNNQRPYILGMARALLSAGWDVVAMNCRGMGGIMNKKSRIYHGGSTDDLEDVIQHIQDQDIYQEIAPVGFSVGGNIILLYLGKDANTVSHLIKKALCFSVPCDLKHSALELARPRNKVFMKYFLRDFKTLMEQKAAAFPDQISVAGFEEIVNFQEFDNRYTAPLHGFKDAEDYWYQSSCKQYLKNVRIKTLIVMAQDDTFMPKQCYPIKESEQNKYLTLVTPRHGGHVGFVAFNPQNHYWSEKTAIQYLND
ncbi:putative hydrolase of the alpha/beta-hydrolase fold [Gynuella sunshinyii YC6258]|uniref:Putative hydrolase of the alpha/beta-hydrolase fold n=1 Tax=Gynuella sunshinyii YC6258 TaxID=1445510 RepID=A0A0C5W0Q5_9GAMM|nr:putative hydrolase of the alpha/beta-hydrolase fold [Gynuella sunshinyii YC6258]